MCVWSGGGCEGDDEKLLVVKGGYEGGLVVVVDLGDLDTGWEGSGAGARDTGEGRDGVLAGLEQSFGDGTSDLTASLYGLLVDLTRVAVEVRTYADDSNTLNAVDEARRLVLGVSWHDFEIGGSSKV